jgi:hypothetical protein
MGIYTNLDMYGIQIYHYIDDDDFAKILFEKKYDTIMSQEQIGEVLLAYEELIKNGNQNLRFQIFTEYSTTYGEGKFIKWFPISSEQFLEKCKHV